MKRIAIVGISIECLERSPVLAQYEDFNILRGKQILDEAPSFIKGIAGRVRNAPGVELCPLVWAGTLPNGAVEASAYARLKNETLVRLEAEGPFDGVLVSGHGAMEVEGLARHGETDFICAVRQAVGERVPLGIALDLHGNLTAKMVRAGTVFDALRTAPHVDHSETGWRTADHLLAVMQQGIKPHSAYAYIPILIAGEQAVTSQEPARSLYASLKQDDAIPGMLDMLLMVGFAWNDRSWSGMGVVATHQSDPTIAAKAAGELAGRIWERRKEFTLSMETASIQQGVQHALAAAERPLYLSDSGDNTTAGATGDSTVVLKELLAQDVQDAVVAGIWAPQTVRQCQTAGVGARVTLQIGTEQRSLPAESLPVEAVIEALGTGEGEWARLRCQGVIVTFHTRRVGIMERAQYQRLGIDPQAHRIYVIKLGYLVPEIAEIAKRHILLLSPGAANLDFPSMHWEHVHRPVYPLDREMDWEVEVV
jgi:microcystin degradation protein MlrC